MPSVAGSCNPTRGCMKFLSPGLFLAVMLAGCAGRATTDSVLVHAEVSPQGQVMISRPTDNDLGLSDEEFINRMLALSPDLDFWTPGNSMRGWLEIQASYVTPSRQSRHGEFAVSRLGPVTRIASLPAEAIPLRHGQVIPMAAYLRKLVEPHFVLLYPDIEGLPGRLGMNQPDRLPGTFLEYGLNDFVYSFQLDQDGRPFSIKLEESWQEEPGPEQYARQQLEKWKFIPFRVNGEVDSEQRLRITIRVHSGDHQLRHYANGKPLPGEPRRLNRSPDGPGRISRPPVISPSIN